MVSSVGADYRESEAISKHMAKKETFDISTIPEVKHWLPGPYQLKSHC